MGKRESHTSDGIVILAHSLAILTWPVMSAGSLRDGSGDPQIPHVLSGPSAVTKLKVSVAQVRVERFSSHSIGSQGRMLDSRMTMV